ncbi:hypothetical protein N9P20_00895 [Polaribacter sp.]|nr:hypothetical protein [Polaribacter sp.]
MGKKYTTDEIEVGGHMLDASMMGSLNTVVTDSPSYLTNNPSSSIHMSNGHYVTFYGNTGSSAAYHSIGGVDSNGNPSDDIRINSYHNVLINLDSNNNNTDSTTSFIIGQHGGTNTVSDQFFIVRSDGRVGINNISPSEALDVTGKIVASVDIKAPIFYDSNNTTYYLNPANTSRFRALELGVSNTTDQGTLLIHGYIANKTSKIMTTDGNLHIDAAAGNHATYINFYTGTGGVKFGNGATGTNAEITSLGILYANQARASWFYDKDNTTYYTNPAGISKLYQLRVDEGDGGMNSNFLFGQAGSQEHRLFGAANQQYNLIGSSSPIFKWGQSATDGNHNIKMTLENSGLNVAGVLTATGGTSTEWNTAYDWGNYSTGVTRGFLHGKLYSTGGDADTYTNFGIYRNYASNGPIASHTTILHVSQTDGNYGYQLAGSTLANDDGLYFRNFGSAATKVGATWNQLATRAWVTSNANSSNANLLDGLNSTQFLRSDANDDFSGILTGTSSGENLKIGGIRGTAKGSQTGQYIHLYERVHIGGPSGWGASNHGAPGSGLSTWGSANFGMSGGGVIQLNGTTVVDVSRNGIFNNVQIAASIQHAGDTNTWFGFDMGSDIFRVVTNGTERYRVDNDGTGFYGAIGLKNTSSTSKHGIDLYGGAKPNGQPEYGMMFTGTYASGTSGDVTGDWATYFTMNGGADRGWIFKGAQGNTSSISSGGVATFNSAIKSPIFYDSDNTSYYVNPSSTTSINVAGQIRGASVRVTNIITNKIVKFDGSVLSNSIMSDNGSTISVSGNVEHNGLTMTEGTDVDQVKTFALSLTPTTTDWMDTGINYNDLANGTYSVQCHINNSTHGSYDVRYSGMMSWFGSGSTNDTSADEIHMHRAGHAPNQEFSFRTLHQPSTVGTHLKFQIKSSAIESTAATYTFKFRRLI